MKKSSKKNSRVEAREYFRENKLSYNDISIDDIDELCKSLMNTFDWKVHVVRDESYSSKTGKLLYCYLEDGSGLEIISFNRGGFIGLCRDFFGESEDNVIRCFIDFVDMIAENKKRSRTRI